jgi:hypothetical protein
MLGNLSPPWTPSAFQMTQGLTQANGLLKSLQTDGPNVFRQTPTTLTVSAMSPTVPISPYVAGLEEARWVVTPAPNLYERPLGRFQWVDYMNLPNKLSPASSPSIWMFDRQVDATQLYIWPIVSSGGTINCTTIRTANDISLPSDSLDLPSEWVLGFTYMLADGLMDDQGVAAADPATAARISGHAKLWWDKLDNFDRPTSIFVRPWGKKGSGKFWR